MESVEERVIYEQNITESPKDRFNRKLEECSEKVSNDAFDLLWDFIQEKDLWKEVEEFGLEGKYFGVEV